MGRLVCMSVVRLSLGSFVREECVPAAVVVVVCPLRTSPTVMSIYALLMRLAINDKFKQHKAYGDAAICMSDKTPS